VAIAVHPTLAVLTGFLGAYAVLRVAMASLIGVHGMKQPRMGRKMALIPVWDAVAFAIWLASFTRSTIRWRGVNYTIRDGMLVLPAEAKAQNAR
jgi:ceramide glucosyltransferase